MNNSIDSLLEIINNNDAKTADRLSACELLLAFESPPEAAAQAKALLSTIFGTAGVAINHRLEALRIMRKSEAARVSQQSAKAVNSAKDREVWRDLEIAARRMKLIRAGVWKEAVKRGDWCDDLLADNYTPPPPGTEIDSLFKD